MGRGKTAQPAVHSAAALVVVVTKLVVSVAVEACEASAVPLLVKACVSAMKRRTEKHDEDCVYHSIPHRKFQQRPEGKFLGTAAISCRPVPLRYTGQFERISKGAMVYFQSTYGGCVLKPLFFFRYKYIIAFPHSSHLLHNDCGI
jgi:hypothetical protein